MRLHTIAIILPGLVLGACAAARPAAATLPTALEPEHPHLPTADRDAVEIRDDAGDDVSAKVAFCVAPDGHVQSVHLAKPSLSHAYDVDVVRDIADWHFDGGDWTSVTTALCETATIDYRIL